MVVRERLPGRTVRTVILAHRSPLPLGEIRAPALPMLLASARFFEPAIFRGLDSWHVWLAHGKKFQVMVALFPDKSSVYVGARACSGKSRRRRNDAEL